MRETARRVGAALRERVGFRGAFTIDGVLSEDGFLPTELNPRFGAGLGPISMALPTLPFPALSLALAEGEDLDYRPEWLESVLVQAADRQRFGRSMFFVRKEISETTTHRIAHDEGGHHLARDGEDSDGTFLLGPGTLGGFFSFVPDPGSVPAGAFFAPYVVEAFALADRVVGTGIGDVEAARPTR